MAGRLPLVGQRALVTGAGEGIGAAIAGALGDAGARLVLTDRRVDRLAAQRAALEARGVDVEVALCDVADAAAVGGLALRLLSAGPIDILVNNAGVAHAGPTLDASLADWGAIIGVNLMGVVHHLHHFGPAMRAAGRGHIVNIASAAALHGLPGMGPYAASKAAVLSISESLQAELSGSGLRVHVVLPGFVQTQILEDGRISAAGRERARSGLVGRLMGREGRTPKVVADAVLRAILSDRPVVPVFAEPLLLGLGRRLSPALVRRGMAAVGGARAPVAPRG